jgi:hypothetical protein
VQRFGLAAGTVGAADFQDRPVPGAVDLMTLDAGRAAGRRADDLDRDSRLGLLVLVLVLVRVRAVLILLVEPAVIGVRRVQPVVMAARVQPVDLALDLVEFDRLAGSFVGTAVVADESGLGLGPVEEPRDGEVVIGWCQTLVRVVLAATPCTKRKGLSFPSVSESAEVPAAVGSFRPSVSYTPLGDK